MRDNPLDPHPSGNEEGPDGFGQPGGLFLPEKVPLLVHQHFPPPDLHQCACPSRTFIVIID